MRLPVQTGSFHLQGLSADAIVKGQGCPISLRIKAYGWHWGSFFLSDFILQI
jgi:hypothetical protein